MNGEDWEILIDRIQDQKCIPFIGPGINSGAVPPKSEIAHALAGDTAEYPNSLGTKDLRTVSQYIATMNGDTVWPRRKMLKNIEARKLPRPDYTDPKRPHRILAGLPIKIYITTNFDDFMAEALRSAPTHKDPKREVFKWNDSLRYVDSALDGTYSPTVAVPLVFHLHGHSDILESLVVTEDHYLDFLTCQEPIPSLISGRLNLSSLLFLGYRLPDFEFKVLIRSVARILKTIVGNPTATGSSNFSVLQIDSTVSADEVKNVKDYLSRYCGENPPKIKVYWGDVDQFLMELKQRMDRK